MWKELTRGLPTNPLPPLQPRDPNIAHAPVRRPNLSVDEKKLAITNALRYIPSHLHTVLAPEFAEELENYGHIYMYRFLPSFPLRAYPIHLYFAKSQKSAAIMLMIMNNLDPKVAQFPQELVTYGGNGQVFSNWAQFWLVMQYLSEMSDEQTLVMYSGHPLGLFPSNSSSPNLVITNGMMVPNYSSKEAYEKFFAIGVTMYGQMTAGSYCYIGPQGIVHGTTITVLNAARKRLGTSNLHGKVFVTSGLGGMSSAQAKAGVICGCTVVVAEVSLEALEKRKSQNWLMEVTYDLDECIDLIRQCRKNKSVISIGYHGNAVDLWEKLAQIFEETGELLVDLGSDQTSCHNCYHGGYIPVGLTYKESLRLMEEDPENFKQLVKNSLCRHVTAINKLSAAGLYFWDYGNAFLLEASKAGADVGKSDTVNGTKFRYPSYVQDIMGDIFSLGFGPFRWVCTSGDEHDLHVTDKIASDIIEKFLASKDLAASVKEQYQDNLRWIQQAAHHNLVVGSQSRILYADQAGRIAISVAFNKAICSGVIKSPVVISRDHHDVSGTDSPYRETSNIYDGSSFTADMSVQNCIGDSFRGATWIALHNGGGVGWGEVMNGGFGLVLDGTQNSEENAKRMLAWDVSNGVARRCWSGNENAEATIKTAMQVDSSLRVTLPNHVTDATCLDKLFTSL